MQLMRPDNSKQEILHIYVLNTGYLMGHYCYYLFIQKSHTKYTADKEQEQSKNNVTV